jgi:hypothetical protein
MKIFQPWVSNEWMIKWSPLFLLFSIALLLLSLSFGPSAVFLSWSVIFGLVNTVLTLAYWKCESRPASLIIFITSLAAWYWGVDLTFSRAFPSTPINDLTWQPITLYFSISMTILFLTLFLGRSWLKGYLAPKAELS